MVDVTIQGEWSYAGDPSASPRDEVRYRIGDIDETNPLLSDEEIDYELAQAGDDVLAAAIGGVRRLIARWMRAVDKSVEGLSVSYSQRITNAQALLKELLVEQAQGADAAAPHIFSPTTKDAKPLRDDEADRPYFVTDRDRFPGT